MVLQQRTLQVMPDLTGRWFVQPTLPDGASYASEHAAVAAARATLAPLGGGSIVVVDARGYLRRRIQVDADASKGEQLSLMDLVHGVPAAHERAHGRDYDADGDGEADGADAIEKITTIGPRTASSKALQSSRVAFEVILSVVALVASASGVTLVADGLGSGPGAVFLSTLACSLGVAGITAVLILGGRSVNVPLMLMLSAAFLVLSNIIAAVSGLDTLEVPLPGAGPSGAVRFIGEFLTAAARTYGPVGVVLSIASGVLVGWRAADLYRHYS